MATVYILVSYSQILDAADTYTPGDVFGEAKLINRYNCSLSEAKMDFELNHKKMEVFSTSDKNKFNVTYYALEEYELKKDENGEEYEEYIGTEDCSDPIQIAFNVSDYPKFDALVDEVAAQCDCDHDQAIKLICDSPKYFDLEDRFEKESPWWIARFVKDNM